MYTHLCFTALLLRPRDQDQSHKFRALLRDIYLTDGGDTKTLKISTELSDFKQGTAVFDSTTPLLQDLFQSITKNHGRSPTVQSLSLLCSYRYTPGACPCRCSLILLRYSPFISLTL